MKDPCRLCGVSLNVGRFRTADEPPESGWIIDQEWSDRDTPIAIPNACKVENGCYLNNPNGLSNGPDDESDDQTGYIEEEDSDWLEEEGSEYEEYEFDSDEDRLSEELVVEEELGNRADRNVLRNDGKCRYTLRNQRRFPTIGGSDSLAHWQSLRTLPRTIRMSSPQAQNISKGND